MRAVVLDDAGAVGEVGVLRINHAVGGFRTRSGPIFDVSLTTKQPADAKVCPADIPIHEGYLRR